MHRQTVRSVAELNGSEHGPFDAVVVAAGAAVGTIQELEGVLPLQVCQVRQYRQYRLGNDPALYTFAAAPTLRWYCHAPSTVANVVEQLWHTIALGVFWGARVQRCHAMTYGFGAA